jgi:hypothetical protein
MGTYTTVRTSVRKDAERNFQVSGHTAWVCRLVTEDSGQTVGVRLKVLRPFACSPNDYFTNDAGNSFVQASNFFVSHGIDISLGEIEADTETITTLQQVFKTWESASGHSERRAVIRETCIGLRELFQSLTQTPSLSHLQDVGRIEAHGQSLPDQSLQELEEQLTALLRHLRSLDAGDGEKILSPQRFEKYLNQSLRL